MQEQDEVEEAVSFTDWDLAYHARDAPLSVKMVASNGKYVDPCLDMLVNNFMPPMESHMLRNACVQAIKEQVLPRVHTGLEVIVDLVPMAAINLSTTVVQKRPMFFRKDFNTDHLKCHIYLKNILMLEGGAIREFVGNNMLVEVVAIGWDEMIRDDLCKGFFTMELEDEDEVADDDGQANNDGELPSTLILKSLGKSVTADLLDSLMIQFLSI